MEEKSIWSIAALPGIIIASVSIAYQLICLLAGNIQSAFVQSMLSLLLWTAKFVGSLFLMYFFMKRFADEFDPDNRRLYRYGLVLALYSALVYSAFYFAYAQYIVPDLFDQAFELMAQSYAQAVPQDALDAMMNLRPDLPKITFFVNLGYCFIFGLCVSSIFSRRLSSRNPFKNNKDNNTDEQ